MKRVTRLVGVAILVATARGLGAAEAPDTGLPLRQGVAVVLGLAADGGRGVLTDLAERERWMVLFQSPDPRETTAVREWAEERGLLGDRVFVAQGGYGRIVLADNLATAAWCRRPRRERSLRRN